MTSSDFYEYLEEKFVDVLQATLRAFKIMLISLTMVIIGDFVWLFILLSA